MLGKAETISLWYHQTGFQGPWRHILHALGEVPGKGQEQQKQMLIHSLITVLLVPMCEKTMAEWLARQQSEVFSIYNSTHPLTVNNLYLFEGSLTKP